MPALHVSLLALLVAFYGICNGFVAKLTFTVFSCLTVMHEAQPNLLEFILGCTQVGMQFMNAN